MKKINGKELAIDLLTDIVGGMLIAIGIYNFAVKAQFPMTGFSGVALIFYHLFHIPIGAMTILLNIPVVFLCYKLLGRTFFLRSLKTMIISSILMDVVAPMLPVSLINRKSSKVFNRHFEASKLLIKYFFVEPQSIKTDVFFVRTKQLFPFDPLHNKSTRINIFPLIRSHICK